MSKPFIYIAALRRSGSNLLCEALTLPPHSYMLREPGFARGKFAVKPNDAEYFAGHGIDLTAFRRKMLASCLRRGGGANLFIDELLPRLRTVVGQVGIKEISHRHWQVYRRRLPDLRTIILGRDPRDLYLSLVHKARERRVNWRGTMTPQSVAEHLNRQFALQQEMIEQINCLRVRYEDFCSDPAVYQRIKNFVNSDIPESGAIGQLNRHNAAVHGGIITTTSVRRWQRETNPQLREQACRVGALMAEYSQAWGYEPS